MIVASEVILYIIGGLLLIISWFIRQWMKSTGTLFLETEKTLGTLNDTLNKLNINLEVYQATMNENLKAINEKISHNEKTTESNTYGVQDHEIRITILEKTVK